MENTKETKETEKTPPATETGAVRGRKISREDYESDNENIVPDRRKKILRTLEYSRESINNAIKEIEPGISIGTGAEIVQFENEEARES